MSERNRKLLFDPMKHPEWIPPQTPVWYTNLALETGGYKYPWNSEFDEPSAEMIFADKISSYLSNNSRVLDVGCGHGEFTTTFADKAKEVIGIDLIEGFITSAQKRNTYESINFIVVDADQKLPFPDDYFDMVYTKKGPWLYHRGIVEGPRVIKAGGIAMGLYHGGTDGGLRKLFPGLYSPFRDDHVENIKIECERILSESCLEKVEIQIIEEVEYLSSPEDVLIKKCFGQNDRLKEVVWRECLNDVEEIFNKNATPKGLKVINYHSLMIGKAM